MNYNTQVLTYNVFVPMTQIKQAEENPELQKGYEINFVKQAVENLARSLIEGDMVHAEKEYNMERQGFMHTFSVRVEPPQ